MGINYRCSCGQQLVVEEQYAGMRIRCPACGTEAVVPSPAVSGGPVQANMPVHAAAAAKARTQAQIGLWCGILALVFFIVFVVTCMILGNGLNHGSFTGFRPTPGVAPTPTESFLVLGFWGVSILLSIVATVFGALGRKKINMHNRGVATAGMVLGIVSLSINCCCCATVLVVVIAALGSARH